MKNRLRIKLKSCRGASILMALLFMLVCMMVASSVLMAAASNSGKLRSNQQEQQKYLALASALRLVCDELTAAEYIGQYNYNRQPVYETTDDGSTHYVKEIYTYSQRTGDFACELTEGSFDNLLPLRRDLDILLAGNFKLAANQQMSPHEYIFDTGLITGAPDGAFNGSYQLLVQPNVDGLPEVNISVKLRNDGIIRLTATLGEAADGYLYTMEAELVPQQSLKNIFYLLPPGSAGLQSGLNQTAAVKWDLNWIAKKEAAAS